MGRLIDADEFKETLGTDTKIREMFCRIIDEQPTAYDVEKVLNELDERSSRCKIRSRSIFSDDDYRFNDLKRYEKHSSDMQAHAYDTAIDIVKAGGVE